MNRCTLLINCPQEYLGTTDFHDSLVETNRFFMCISKVFLPLLDMFARLKRDNIPFSLSLVLPPATCTMLADSTVCQAYVEHLDRRIALGERLLAEYTVATDAIKAQLKQAREDRRSFTEVYGGNLLSAFNAYRKSRSGNIHNVELLATCGTNIFLPHYIDMEETCSAQIETGLYSYKTFFGEAADGFFLPEMGYTNGLERILRSYGVRYTVLDARSVLFCADTAPLGIFSPVFCATNRPNETPLAVFARDNRIDDEIFGSGGYAQSSKYCDIEKDASYILPSSMLAPLIDEGAPRFPSLYRVWNRGGTLYDAREGEEEAERDAVMFIKRRLDLFSQAKEAAIKDARLSLVYALSTDDILDKWQESITWLEKVFRFSCGRDITFCTLKESLHAAKDMPHIHPYFSAATPQGYGENLNSGRNSWMLAPARRASIRMVDLAERFSDGGTLKARLLGLASRELLLSQSLSWAARINEHPHDMYAIRRFKEGIQAFTTVFECLGSNTVATSWLTSLEAEHKIFPWINYKIFSRKH